MSIKARNLTAREIFKNRLLWTAASELGGLILVYNRYSEQSVCNLTKRRTLPLVFSGEIIQNQWLQTAASEQSKRKISKKMFLVELFCYIIATLNSQSVT